MATRTDVAAPDSARPAANVSLSTIGYLLA